MVFISKFLHCAIFDEILEVMSLTLQKIKNPDYKGKWKIPLIDNPGKPLHVSQLICLRILSNFSRFCVNLRINCWCDVTEFEEDPDVYVLPPLKFFGIELWQVWKVLFECSSTVIQSLNPLSWAIKPAGIEEL